MTEGPKPYGSASRGVTASDVERAADALLRTGERPTIDRIRQKLGTGSPNTVNPLLDAWWKRLGSRLHAGPAAFHRLPESVAHVAEALWMQALDEGRQRAQLELKSKERSTADQQQTLEVRSHVLSLREGELDARLRDRDNTVAALNVQLRQLSLLLHKEQLTCDAQAKRIAVLESESLTRAQPPRKPRGPKQKPTVRRARQRQRPAAATAKQKDPSGGMTIKRKRR
jgi:hypothetical protein